ncbi:MAG TPA: DUF3696 domain-containing protein [Micromonosporaceae bacterium]|nr:DUF3696 domain-containing protein [Micromonosporaceae bacterium]
MITSLGLSNFKRFHSLDLSFAPLTVLTGLNGTGKSTVVQSLLLARQAAGAGVVQLNGPDGLALGEAFDVLHPDAEQQVIEIRVGEPGGTAVYRLGVPDDRALNLPVLAAPDQPSGALSGAGAAFTYLNAERLGPRDQLDVTAAELSQIGVGPRGEYTGQVLALHTTEEVREPLRHPSTAQHGVTTLRTQVESWASDIIRPIRITATWPPGITASLIRFQEPGTLADQIRPTNMGFGVSFALPILVAGLLAPPDALLIVENPEAHLHPGGQSRLGRFLGRVAASGVQVVVETHSDHMLNGIRLACVEERLLAADQVDIHFFSEQAGGAPTTVGLTPKGGLTDWPKGFFDQLDEDLGRISRAKRRT